MVVKKFKELKTFKKIKGEILFEDGSKEQCRFSKENEQTMFIFAKRSRVYGDRIHLTQTPTGKSLIFRGKKVVGFEIGKTDKEKWIYSLNRAIAILEKSGWWERLIRKFKIAREVGYEKLKEAEIAYDANYCVGDYKESERLRTEAVKKIDTRLIYKNERGEDTVDRETFTHWSYPLKIKKMYFGRSNERILKEIEEAVRKNEKIQVGDRANYDVSFQYNPDGKLAWYSEEYKNCGNGHYYLALNSKYAVYYEDD